MARRRSGDGVGLEGAARLDERGVAVPQELEAAERGGGLLVSPARARPSSPRSSGPRPPPWLAVAAEEAAAGLGVDVQMRVDITRMHDPAARVDDARRAKARRAPPPPAPPRRSCGPAPRWPPSERPSDARPSSAPRRPSGSESQCARRHCHACSAPRSAGCLPAGSWRRQRSRTAMSISTPRPGPSGG